MASKQIRPIRVEGNIAYVPLTKGYVAVIDAADVPLVEGRNWCAVVTRRSVYASYEEWIGGKMLRRVLMHRAIASTPEGFETDHEDCDGLNNRRANLRIVTPSQNRCNQRKGPRNTSGVKGASWHKASGKWRAQIMLENKKCHLGLYATIEEAAAAYAAASADMHGPYGRTE